MVRLEGWRDEESFFLLWRCWVSSWFGSAAHLGISAEPELTMLTSQCLSVVGEIEEMSECCFDVFSGSDFIKTLISRIIVDQRIDDREYENH